MKRVDRVLFWADSEVPDAVALERAVSRARVWNARLHIVDVVSRGWFESRLAMRAVSFQQIESAQIEDRQAVLDDTVANITSPDVQISSAVLVGDPVPTIVGEVVEGGHDILFKGPASEGTLRRSPLGTSDMRLVRACPCPVAIVGAEQSQGLIVAAVDVTSTADASLNRAIMDWALKGYLELHPKLHVLHAWVLYGESILGSPRMKMDSDQLAKLRENERKSREVRLNGLIDGYCDTLDSETAEGFSATPLLVKGDPRTSIPAKIRELEADMLILGSAAREGLGQLLIGNTAEALLGRVECSVLVVKPEGLKPPRRSAQQPVAE